MKLLLGSGGFRTEPRVALWSKCMRELLGPLERVLFVPYALADHDGYVRTMIERGLNAGYALDGIHQHAEPRRAVEEAQAIFVGGGNTFRLLDCLYRFGLVDAIRDRVRAGIVYLGISAGTNVACPTIMTTNDMPIVQPPTLQALSLVPFQINPHYVTGQFYVKGADGFQEHFGETRDDRIREFHELNDTPVIGLWEGGVLRIDKERVLLEGSAARLFRRSLPSADFMQGTSLPFAV